MVNYDLLAFVALLFLITRLYSDARISAYRDKSWWLFGLPINIMFPSSLCAAYWALGLNELWGYASLLLAAVGNVLFAMHADYARRGLGKIVAFLGLVSVFNLAAIISTLYWIKRSPPSPEPNWNTEVILTKLESIQKSFSTIRKNIEEEEVSLKKSIDSLVQKVESQSAQLSAMAAEKEMVQQQLRQLTLITDRKQEEVDAILRQYKRDDDKNRIQDLIFGAILGAIVTALTGIIFKRVSPPNKSTQITAPSP